MVRATATVLFTDLVGSTELRGRLGEEAADELRCKHDQLLAQAVEANSGRVVKGLGDGIMATFAGASDAVTAAVAIQQAIDGLNRSAKTAVPLEVRVGLSAGDVAFEDDDVHGLPVIEASRLCGAAVGGEILASEIVPWLGGAQGAPALTPVGSLELKGLTAPVPAVRIEMGTGPGVDHAHADPADRHRPDLRGSRRRARTAGPAVEGGGGGRAAGRPCGERAGRWQNSLAARIAQSAYVEGAVVLAGRCDEDLGVPYQPFVEALQHYRPRPVTPPRPVWG